jgi:hypothetical protein
MGIACGTRQGKPPCYPPELTASPEGESPEGTTAWHERGVRRNWVSKRLPQELNPRVKAGLPEVRHVTSYMDYLLKRYEEVADITS